MFYEIREKVTLLANNAVNDLLIYNSYYDIKCFINRQFQQMKR